MIAKWSVGSWKQLGGEAHSRQPRVNLKPVDCLLQSSERGNRECHGILVTRKSDLLIFQQFPGNEPVVDPACTRSVPVQKLHRTKIAHQYRPAEEGLTATGRFRQTRTRRLSQSDHFSARQTRQVTGDGGCLSAGKL